MRTQIHTNTIDGYKERRELKERGRGRGRTLQTTCRQILPLIERHSLKIIPHIHTVASDTTQHQLKDQLLTPLREEKICPEAVVASFLELN